MSKHAKPIVVRLWKNYAEPAINAVVDDWDDGRFTLPPEHPMMKEITEHAFRDTTYILTVLDTDELEWDIYQFIDLGAGINPQVRCAPRHEKLRKSLRADEWLIAKGLVS